MQPLVEEGGGGTQSCKGDRNRAAGGCAERCVEEFGDMEAT